MCSVVTCLQLTICLSLDCPPHLCPLLWKALHQGPSPSPGASVKIFLLTWKTIRVESAVLLARISDVGREHLPSMRVELVIQLGCGNQVCPS